MPFEAGLAIAFHLNGSGHDCAFFESKQYRLQSSLSDLNGFDPIIHDGNARGVLSALTDLFESSLGPVDASDLMPFYGKVAEDAVRIKARNGNTLFRATSFRQLVIQSQYRALEAGFIPQD